MIVKFLITQPKQVIDLSHTIPDFHTCRLTQFSYKQITNGQRQITLFISGMNTKFDATENKHYFFTSLMSTFSNAMVSYQSQDPQQVDYVSRVSKPLNQITVLVEIDGFPSTDVSVANPVMVELEFI